MSFLQRFFVTIFPKAWSESMEAESRSWIALCECGHGQSIWDLGGIRWKAAGHPSRRFYCPKCQCATWHTVVKEEGKPIPK